MDHINQLSEFGGSNPSLPTKCSVREHMGFTELEIKGHKNQRKVERPSYEQLLKELEESNYTKVGRKYGVSDNTIRKWIRMYEKHGENY
jgi:hypothetical protein